MAYSRGGYSSNNKYDKSCASCQRRETPKIPMGVPLKNQMASNPFQVLSVDFQGPYTISEARNKYILVFMDHFTKWCETTSTKDQLATNYDSSNLCQANLLSVRL